MKQIIVMDRDKAKRFSYGAHDFTSVIVSINDTWDVLNPIAANFVPNGIKAVCRLIFDDVEKGQPNCMTEKDAEKIAEFVHQWKDNVDVIIVHCRAGVSRSAGVAAAISKHVFNDDNWVFDSPKYQPNMTCYRYTLEALYNKI